MTETKIDGLFKAAIKAKIVAKINQEKFDQLLAECVDEVFNEYIGDSAPPPVVESVIPVCTTEPKSNNIIFTKEPKIPQPKFATYAELDTAMLAAWMAGDNKIPDVVDKELPIIDTQQIIDSAGDNLDTKYDEYIRSGCNLDKIEQSTNMSVVIMSNEEAEVILKDNVLYRTVSDPEYRKERLLKKVKCGTFYFY